MYYFRVFSSRIIGVNTIDNPIPIYNETPAKIYTESSCKSSGEE